jgi:hypothetical protein
MDIKTSKDPIHFRHWRNTFLLTNLFNISSQPFASRFGGMWLSGK